MIPVLVTTEFRGVFFGYTSKSERELFEEENIVLHKCKNVIYFGTSKGFLELADTGPTCDSKIGSEAKKVILKKITSVAYCTEAAEKAFADA